MSAARDPRARGRKTRDLVAYPQDALRHRACWTADRSDRPRPGGAGEPASAGVGDVVAPIALERAQDLVHRRQLLAGDDLALELDRVLLVQLVDPPAKLEALLRHPHPGHAAVVGRAFLAEIAILDQLLDVVGDIRAQVVAARGQFADRQLLVADVRQDQALHVVDVLDPEPIELRLDDIEEASMETLDQPDGLKVALFHGCLEFMFLVHPANE